jgi:two-component system, NtrC family, nitrogen regulation sensor histidine kinase NtrY
VSSIDRGEGILSRAGRSGEDPERTQSVPPRPLAPRERVAWVAAWVVVLALPLWIARLSGVALAVAAVGVLVWGIARVRRRDRGALVITGVLALAVGIAGGVQLRLLDIATEWPRVGAQVEERAATALNRELDELVRRGEVAVEGVERALGGRGPAAPGAALFGTLEQLRAANRVEALTLYDANGVALAWAGEHRGTVPVEVRRGERSYTFAQGPLFSYLYFVRPLPSGHSVMAAMLLDAQIVVGEGSAPFAERFARRLGVRPRFTSPERARGESIWDWSTDRPILSVSFATLTQQAWWERVVERGRTAVGGVWAIGFLALSVLWYRRHSRMPALPVAAGTAGLLLLPLGQGVTSESLFSPLLFVLPGPLDVTLGMLLVLLFGSAVWLLTHTGRLEWGRGAPVWVTAPIAGAICVGALLLVERSAATGLLAGAVAGGLALQVAATLLIAIPLFLLLGSQRRNDSWRTGTAIVLAGLSLAVILGAALVLLWHPERPIPIWSAAVWALPFALIARGYAPAPPRRRVLRDWVFAGWLAATAAVPHLWVMHTAAELEIAEGELARLGTETDPFLNFLLRQFSERAVEYHRDGEEGVNLLYHSWVSSGLAREGYEAALGIWSGGELEKELRLSEVTAAHPTFAPAVREFGHGETPVVERYTDVEGLHYLLLVSLPEDRVISVAVPPRYRTGRATALARFLQPGRTAGGTAQHDELYLLPISTEEREEVTAGLLDMRDVGVGWSRVPNGWRSEARAHFPAGWMHAHLLVRTTALPLLAIRGLLLLAGVLILWMLLWTAGRLLCGELPEVGPLRRRWLGSFRGRLTVALFVFFLAPMAIFGAVAYGAVAREVVRSAGGLAHRSLEQAARELSRASLGEVGSLVGADLLLFRQGALVGSSAPEVLDLGLFHSWLPPDVHLSFTRGEDLEEREERRLAGNDYLIAYRRLDPAVVLAAPAPLASDEITRRQHEFAHVALLMSLLGAAFSVVLSLLVGRALTRPLDELGHAVATVGTGNLRVRLPEGRRDEFGSVYAAFNRMVRGIRRARTALVRETRRTETIVAEAATGVLALDARRRVELVNPRASEILGQLLPVGVEIPRANPLLSALADAVDRFWAAGAVEATHEIEVEGRSLRLRLRRLSGPEEERGAVAALEDVTSEIRTARVLAWGEMARQVAHEIKNPLTPIKLSVQHVRRAYQDRRPDFSDILDRNVEAVLGEIDRLGEISRAFARFGTPEQEVERPESVDLLRAVEDTLALYRGSEDGLTYSVDVQPGAPVRAIARTGELKEVLVNLLENAREALNGGGEIRVSLAPLDSGRVELSVADSGEGIPAEFLDTVFEPHFSTRTSGTGLGLAIVRRLVESWGAEVSAHSRPGEGTRFSIRLLTGAPPDGTG